MRTHCVILQFVILVILIWTCSGTRNPLGFLDSALSGTVGLLGNTLQSVVTPIAASGHNNFGGASDHQHNRGMGHRHEFLDNLHGGTGGDNGGGREGGGGGGGGVLSGVTDLLDNTLKIATNTIKDLPETISHTVQTVTAPISNAASGPAGGGLLGVPDLLDNTLKTATSGVANAVKDIPNMVAKTMEGVADPITAVADPFGFRDFFGLKSICESFMEHVWSGVSAVGGFFETMYKIFIQPQIDAMSFVWNLFPFKF